MSLHDKLAIIFKCFWRKVDKTMLAPKDINCTDCDKWIHHCECVARGQEEVEYK